jgi:hypothetical protein
MQRMLIISLAVAAAFGQKIENRSTDRSTIIRLATSLNHLSVIELREPVVQVAAGSSSFKVEWRENRVFVSPLEPDAQTNLFIWTPSGRHTYELMTASKVDDAVFAVDHEAPVRAATAPPPASTPSVTEPPKLPVEMILEASPIAVSGRFKDRRRVHVLLKDLYRKGGRVYVRYVVVNDGRQEYLTGVPDVVELSAAQSPISLIPLAHTQLGDDSRLTYRSEVPLQVVHAESAATVPAGTTAHGVVVFSLPAAAPRGERLVVRLEFPRAGNVPVNALLVM